MSRVIRLRNRQTGALAAGKRIKKGCKIYVSGDYMNEVQILQKLARVPGIVALLGIYDEGMEFWTVLELCAGGRLESWLQTYPDSVSRITRELLGVVMRLHSMLICHLDLKPDNVLLTESGSVRLIDFVTSCQLSAADQQLLGNCGTEGFKAPEVVRGVAYFGLLVDIFSLGCTLQVVSRAAPRWCELAKACREMTIEDPKRRPHVATVYDSLCSNGGGKGDVVVLDFASLDTVSSREVSGAAPSAAARCGNHEARLQSIADPPEIRSRFNKATTAGRERSSSVEASALAGAQLAAPADKCRSAQQAVAAPRPVQACSFSQGASGVASVKIAQAAKGVPKRAPACGSVLCARVGVCLCKDQPPEVAGTPQERAGARKGLRRCNTP